jgi:predicted O-methyltransferase YrrM
MEHLPAPVTRVFRRLARVKRLQAPVTFASDRLEHLMFRVDSAGCRAAQRDFQSLRSIKEQFNFSNRFFGPAQIEAEITGLLSWAAEHHPRTVCEIGTAMGGTTFLLGQTLPEVERLIGVDLYVRRKERLRFLSRPSQQLTFFDGSSYAPETVDRVRAELGSRKLDLLFIDGDHSFEGVARDFESYRHMVRDGGIVVFHDIVEDYMTRYGRPTGRWVGQVPRFWREIKPFYQTREFIESPEQDGLGIGALLYDSAVTPPSLV